MKSVFRYLGVFLLWNLALGVVVLFLPPLLGLFLALNLAGLLLWGYILRPGDGRLERRWALLRLRPLRGEAARWTAIAVPVLLLLNWAVGEIYIGIIPVPDQTLNPFEPIMATAHGRLTIAVLAIGMAPIIEEFFFRGMIQSTLERRWGALWGIVAAAAIFAVVHVLPWVLPLHLFLGMTFGYAVYATRSIWSGVVLHAANNTAAMAGLVMYQDDPIPTVTAAARGPSMGWPTALVALAISLALAAWTARGLWRAGRDTSLRRG